MSCVTGFGLNPNVSAADLRSVESLPAPAKSQDVSITEAQYDRRRRNDEAGTYLTLGR